MTTTTKTGILIAILSRLVPPVFGISVDLTGLVIDDADLEPGYGRE
jgi:hypothetical protein